MMVVYYKVHVHRYTPGPFARYVYASELGEKAHVVYVTLKIPASTE